MTAVPDSPPRTCGEEDSLSRLSEEALEGVGEDVEKLPEDVEYITTERQGARALLFRRSVYEEEEIDLGIVYIGLLPTFFRAPLCSYMKPMIQRCSKPQEKNAEREAVC